MTKRIAILIFAIAFLPPIIAAAASSGASAQPADSLRSMNIENIVVTGTRVSETTNNLPMSVSVITESQLEARQEQSVLPLLVERVPSLMITARSVMGYGASGGAAGGMTMRGIGSTSGGSSSMLMLIDGHPQFMGIFSHPLADTYQTLMAERVEVVRGPASVLYGSNAMGGVINILTRQQKYDGVNTHLRAMYGSYNTLSTQATNTARFGKFNSVLSLGYNRSGGHRDNMDYEQYSGYAKVGYDFTAHWKSFADLNLSKAYSTNPGSVDAPMFDSDRKILRGVTSLSFENRYDRTSGTIKVYYNFGDHFVNDGHGEGGSPRQNRFNSEDWIVGLTLFQNYSLWSDNQITLGFDLQRFGGRAWNSFINGNPDVEMADEKFTDAAGYVNFQQLLWGKLMVNAGVRFDNHSKASSEWIPQFGLSWLAAANTTVKGIVSKGFRNPSLRELYLWGTANPDLKPERVMNYEVSVSQYLLDRRLGLELNLYYINGDNSIVEVPLQNEQGESRFMNTGRIENHGLELSADYRITNALSINANYSYLHMEHKVIASPKHKLYAGLDYSIKRWTFGTGLQYVNHLILDEALNMDSFVLWNARVSYRATKWFDLFVRGENLLDQNYSYYTGFPMPGATVFGGISIKL